MINQEQKKEFWKIMDVLDNLKVLEHLIIVGSWAEYLYYEAKIFENYTPFIRTQDIDFLIKNKARPKEKVKLIKEFKEIGYDWASSLDGLEVLRNDIFEIQFMLRELGQGNVEPIKYEAFDMKLEGIRDLNIIANNFIEVIIFDKKLCIPKPAVYIIQKMDINHKRGDKQIKDKDSILNLYEYIIDNENHYNDFKEIFKNLKGKQRKRVIRFCNENFIDIPE